MRYSINFGLLALGTMANAATIKVDVGEGGLVFNPASVTAAKGDIVEFHFYPQKHSVVQGSFDSPCKVGGITGFNSGFVPSTKGEAKDVFQVTIDSTDPMWFYCSQISHCQNGMVGVINPPASGNTLDAYKTAAAATSDSEAPTAVSGGVITTSSGDDDDDSSSSSSASATSSASAASSSSAASVASTSASTSAASVSSAVSSVASSVSSAASSVSSAASSSAAVVASSTSASTTPTPTANAGAMGFVGFEMLGLGAVAGGVAMMM